MSKPPKKSPQPASGRSNTFTYILFAIIIVILYGRSVGYEFTIDDDLFVKNNPTVAQGVAGIPHAFSHGSMEHFKGSNFQIYRPALISFFCLEHSLFGMKPQGFHFMNVLLYFLIAVVAYKILRLLLGKWHSDYSLLITLLFLVHPVHTEVVASVKSQDELLAALFNLSALFYFITALRSVDNTTKWMFRAAVCYFFAVFAKESSVAFVAVFPLVFLLEKREVVKSKIKLLLPLVGVALLFIAVRYVVLKDVPAGGETSLVENVLYGANDAGTLTATKAGILWYFIKLQVWPHPLTWDYSFKQIPLMQWSDAMPILSIVGFLLIGVAILFYWKKNPLVSFGFLLFLFMIAPVCNLFFLNGTTFAERFLFLPSFGFILAVIVLVMNYTKADTVNKPAKNAMIVSSAVLFIFCIMTVSRADDWKDNYSIFYSGAEVSSNSSRAQAGLASQYMNMAEASQNMMIRSQYADSAVMCFKRSVEIYPENSSSLYKIGLIASLRGDTATALDYYKRTLTVRPDYLMALDNLGATYSFMNKPDSALVYLQKSLQVDSTNQMAYTNITIVYSQLNDFGTSIRYGEKAIAKGLGTQKIYNTLAFDYLSLGDTTKALYYQQLGNQ